MQVLVEYWKKKSDSKSLFEACLTLTQLRECVPIKTKDLCHYYLFIQALHVVVFLAYIACKIWTPLPYCYPLVFKVPVFLSIKLSVIDLWTLMGTIIYKIHIIY